MYQNNIVSQKIPTQTALYQEVVKEIKEDPQNWQWVQTIYNKSMYPLQNSNAKNNIKKLKKTQAYQIGYKIEDLEQQIRRLSKNLDVVKQCNIQLSQNLRQEQKDLKNLENKIQNAKTFSVKGDKGQLSMNLMRNLEREYCSVLSDIKKMQNKITEIRRSPEFFEYRENQTLVNEYQQQILNLDKISKKFEFQSKNKIIKKQEKLKENVKNQKKKIKWLCQHLQQLEQQLIDKEIGNHQIIFEKEHDKLQIENENLKKELQQLEKEVQENEQKLQDQKINKQCLKYTVNIEQSEKEFFQYIDFYQQVFELDDFYLSEIIQDIEENKIDDLFEVLSSSFDIPKNNMKQLKNNKNFENLVCKDQLKSLYDNFRIYKYNKNIQETQQIENEMDLVQLICKYFIFQQQTQINIYDLYQYNLKHKHIQLQKFTKELQNLMDIKKIKDNQLLLEHNIKKVKIDKQDFSIIVKTCSSSISSNSKINKKNIHQEKQIIKEEPKIEKVQKIQKEKVENIIKHKSTKSLQEQTKPEYVPESQKEIQEMIEETKMKLNINQHNKFSTQIIIMGNTCKQEVQTYFTNEKKEEQINFQSGIYTVENPLTQRDHQDIPPDPKKASKISKDQFEQLIDSDIKNKLDQIGYNTPFLKDVKIQCAHNLSAYKYVNNNEIYCGKMNENQQRTGIGQLILNNGSYYEGDFNKDRMEGQGRLIDKDLNFYEGSFRNNEFFGKGKLVDNQNVIYEGEFEDNMKNGEGQEFWPNGTTFKGNFHDNKKNGHGEFKWSDGSTYEGELINDEFEGYGVYKWSNGKSYKGQFKQSYMHGEGEFHWPEGQVYKGSFKNDQKDGYGELTWATGIVFKGNYKNGKREGEGIMIKDNEQKKGIWTNDRFVQWVDQLKIS